MSSSYHSEIFSWLEFFNEKSFSLHFSFIIERKQTRYSSETKIRENFKHSSMTEALEINKILFIAFNMCASPINTPPWKRILFKFSYVFSCFLFTCAIIVSVAYINEFFRVDFQGSMVVVYQIGAMIIVLYSIIITSCSRHELFNVFPYF